MIYTPENTANIGRGMARVYDGAGEEFTHTTMIDTDTGWIEYIETWVDDEGKRHRSVDGNGDMIKKKVKARLPIKIIWWAKDD